MTQVVGFWRQNPMTGSSDSQIEQIPVGFCIFGLHKLGHSYLRSKNTNLKLEIEPHRKQPNSLHPSTMQMLLHYEYNYYGNSTNTGRVAAAEVGFSTLIENGIHILGDKRFYTIDRLSIPA